MLSGDSAKLYEEEAKRKSGITGAALAGPWAAVRGAAGASWLCARLDPTSKALELVAHGEAGGLAALRAHLADDAVTWAVFAYAPGAPHGEGTRKHAALTVVGPGVSAVKRGKVALQKGGVFSAFEGLSGDAGVFQGAAEATDGAVLAELRRSLAKAELIA